MNVLPSGFCPVRNFFANASLTSATFGPPDAIAARHVAPGEHRGAHHLEEVAA